MTVYITAVSPSSATAHEHVAKVRWVDSNNSTSNTMTTAQAVAWVNKGHKVVVASDTGAVEVQVVKADPPYLRTVANGKWSDNLLALPKF